MKKVKPGIHPKLKDYYLISGENWDVINAFSENFFVTDFTSVSIGRATYYAALLKPTDFFSERYNINREIILQFNEHDFFEPRNIDGIKEIYKKYPETRLEEICSIVISKDSLVFERVKDYLRGKSESQTIIPFTYDEIGQISSQKFISDRFDEFFYSRDLFAFESPIRKDLYLFGRQSIVQEMVNRHLSHENSGVFGLRKVGKTSILYAIERALEKKSGLSILLDCQALHTKKWNYALYSITKGIYSKYKIKFSREKIEYTKQEAPDLFSQDIVNLSDRLSKKKILLILDEVEHITFDLSISPHWKDGNDFILFWQSIRSCFQKSDSRLTYIIAGTNPKSAETSTVNGVDNPIYCQIPFDSFVKQFTFEETKEMVNKLGKYMGIYFDDTIVSLLVQDFGGHPFLIRHVCSKINSIAGYERPLEVNRIHYQKGKDLFNEERGYKYAKMMLDVLYEYYNDEYELLKHLSLGDYDFFYSFTREFPNVVHHLLGYGILKKYDKEYDFKIDLLKEYLKDNNKYKKINLSNKEKIAEISTRRNDIEPKLRKIVRTQLLSALGENNAKHEILKKYGKKHKKYRELSLKDLFNPNKHPIYFSDLCLIMKSNWNQCFKNLFGTDVEKFTTRMDIINELRSDAHAKRISDNNMESFRGAMSWLEEKVSNILD